MDKMTFIQYIASAVRIALLVLLGIPLLRMLKKYFSQMCSQRFSVHSGMLLGRVIFYSGLLFIMITILHECGFNVSALLGVAGVFGFAIGFASQTSISNIISGFFLVLERPFSIGDMIKSNDIVGVVESIDLLSLNIRTSDNKLIRLPNELVLKNSLTNLTYYPYRRIDLLLSFPYVVDVERAKSMIYHVIQENNYCLQNPGPNVTIQKIESHNYDTEIRVFVMVRVWVLKEQFLIAAGALIEQLKYEFDNKYIITIVHNNSH